MAGLPSRSLKLRDQYGNLDTNGDGVINDQDAGYQTDTLYAPVGPGAGSNEGRSRGVGNVFISFKYP